MRFLNIKDEVFRKVLKFVEENKLPENESDNMIDIYAAAAKLKIRKLETFAVERLSVLITCENVFHVLALSHKFNSSRLKANVFTKIQEMFPGKILKPSVAENMVQVRQLLELKSKIDRKMDREIERLANCFEIQI